MTSKIDHCFFEEENIRHFFKSIMSVFCVRFIPSGSKHSGFFIIDFIDKPLTCSDTRERGGEERERERKRERERRERERERERERDERER